MMHQIDSLNSQDCTTSDPFRKKFIFQGRTYKLFKRKQDKNAPYYIHLQFHKQRYKQSLQTNNAATAIERAKHYIRLIFGERWSEVDKIKTKKKGATLNEVLTLYPKIAFPAVSYSSIKQNVGCMRLLYMRAKGISESEFKPELIKLDELTPELISRFQENSAIGYQATARKDEEWQREARDRAFRSTRSMVNQARCLFTKSLKLPDRYRQNGIILPDNIEAFMTCKLLGNYHKREYFAPPDSVVLKAFQEIERLKDVDPNSYKAFWLAVGAGLRRKEIQQSRWEYMIERGGQTWFSGGIGKNGQRIEVPMQKKAVEALAPFRKSEGRIMGDEMGLEWSKRINGWMRSMGWTTEKKLHELRAYIGSLLYSRNPQLAMRFMRHKSIRVTEEFYCRYCRDMAPIDVL